MIILNKNQRGVGVIKLVFLIPLVLIGLVVLLYIYTELNKSYWDYRVKQMCEKDGGVTVYETVELTSEEYIRLGGFKGSIPVPSETASYAEKYLYLSTFEKEIIHKSNPRVYRWESAVYRKLDRKILGKVISYHRGGGDLPTIIGHPSGFDCKDMNIKLDVEKKIFSIKEK